MNTMLKRVGMLGLALLALAGWMILSPDRAMAWEYYGDFAYEIKNGGCEICKYYGSSSYVNIPDYIDYTKVTSIGKYAFYDNSSVRSITIPYGVTSIGDDAFNSCSSLSSIEIPSSVTSIGDYAFYKCTNLTSIEIPSSVTSIGDYAFAYCSSLTTVKLPNSLKSIGGGAFEDCTSLTSIEIPSSVTSIGDWAFAHTASLREFFIPDSVTYFGEYNEAFGLIGYSNDKYSCIIKANCGSAAAKHLRDYNYIQNGQAELIHDPVKDKAVAATCVKDGLTEGSHCQRCNAVIQQQKTIPALGHDIVADKAVAATCTSTGLSEGSHCKRCNAVIQQQKTIPAPGHDVMVDAGYPATCTSKGLSDGSHCKRCNAVIQQQITLSALGHDPVADPAVPATMTATGLTEGSHCSRCGKILVEQQLVPALDAVTSIRFTKDTYRVRVNKEVSLYADVVMLSGAKYVNQFITFTSDDPSVIQVDEFGVVKALKHGHATITARAENGVTATCLVKTWFF